MDLREAYAWLLLIGVAAAIFIMSTYFLLASLNALTAHVLPWTGGAFHHRPADELGRYRNFAIFGMAVTGLGMFGGMGGLLVRFRGAHR